MTQRRLRLLSYKLPLTLYKTAGSDAAIAYYNDPANINGQWYVFIADANDLYVAHPAAPALVGKNINEVLGLDGSLTGPQRLPWRQKKDVGLIICGPIPQLTN